MHLLLALALLALCGRASAAEQPNNPYVTSAASGTVTFKGEFGEVRRLAAGARGGKAVGAG